MNINESFAQHKEQQIELAGYIGSSSEIAEKLDLEIQRTELELLEKKVEDDTFRIQVIGDFNGGKSTVINALLGEKILPTFPWPTTAVINVIRYGETKRAVLHFLNPLPQDLPEELPEKVREHIQQYQGQQIPPMDVPYDELEDYVVMKEDSDENPVTVTPYEKVDLYYPLELLKNGVEVIDSPGLNAYDAHSQITNQYLNISDSVIFVFNSARAAAQNECDYIKNQLLASGFQNILFLINQIDRVDEDERVPFVNKALRRIKAIYEEAHIDTTPELFPISAKQALKGKMAGDEKLVQQSGFEAFTRRLTDYLINDRGRVKLAQPAQVLRGHLSNQMQVIIPEQRSLLTHDLDKLKEMQKDQEKVLHEVELKRDRLEAQFKQRITSCANDFRTLSYSYTGSLISKVEQWIDEYEPEHKIGLFPTKAKTQALYDEIANYVKEKIAEESVQWNHGVLFPTIDDKAELIFDQEAKDTIEQMKDSITEIHREFGDQAYDPSNTPAWQRVVAALGGIVMGDVATAISGGMHGFSRGFATTIGVEVAGGIILGLLGFLNPIAIIGVMIAAVTSGHLVNASQATKVAKKKLTESFATLLHDKQYEVADKLADQVSAMFCVSADAIIEGINSEIAVVRSQLESVINTVQNGTEDIDKHMSMLNQCEGEIQVLSNQLDGFVFSLIAPKA